MYIPIIPYIISFIISIIVLYFLIIRSNLHKVFKYSRFPYISLGIWIMFYSAYLLDPLWIINSLLFDLLYQKYDYFSIDYFHILKFRDTYQLLFFWALIIPTISLVIIGIISILWNKDDKHIIWVHQILIPIFLFLLSYLYLIISWTH